MCYFNELFFGNISEECTCVVFLWHSHPTCIFPNFLRSFTRLHIVKKIVEKKTKKKSCYFNVFVIFLKRDTYVVFLWYSHPTCIFPKAGGDAVVESHECWLDIGWIHGGGGGGSSSGGSGGYSWSNRTISFNFLYHLPCTDL